MPETLAEIRHPIIEQLEEMHACLQDVVTGSREMLEACQNRASSRQVRVGANRVRKAAKTFLQTSYADWLPAASELAATVDEVVRLVDACDRPKAAVPDPLPEASLRRIQEAVQAAAQRRQQMREATLPHFIEKVINRLETRPVDAVTSFYWHAVDWMNTRLINELAVREGLGEIFKEHHYEDGAKELVIHSPDEERPVRFHLPSSRQHPWTWKADVSQLKVTRAIKILEGWLALATRDHPVVRKAIADLIRAQPDMDVCGQAEGVVDWLQLSVQRNPDLVITDLTLKDGNGTELIKEIRSRGTLIKLLVCSMHDEALFAERVLRAGAMGYVCKSAGAEALVDAIRTVINGRIAISEEMQQRLLSRTTNGTAAVGLSPVERLSDREFETFEMIGRGLSTRQIADRLQLSHKTIDSYREHIKAKLGLENASELVQQAVRWVLANP